MLRRRSSASGLLLLAALLLAVPACDEITGGGNEEEREHDPALIGDWLAVEMNLTSATNAAHTVDAIPLTGMFMAVTFNEDGTLAVSEWDPWDEVFSDDTGSWYTADGELTIHWQGDAEAETAGYTVRSDGHIEVDVGPDEEWDFDGDGWPEAADLSFTFAPADGSPDPAMVGSWTATSFVFTSVADPSTSADVIQMGGSFTVTLNGDRSYSAHTEFPDGSGGVDVADESGTYEALDGLLWIHASTEPGPDLVLYTVDGGTAVVTSPDDAFDFDGDGVDDPATLEITFTAS